MNNETTGASLRLSSALQRKEKAILSAYKKLKSCVFFDKTRVHVAKRIVEYEEGLRAQMRRDSSVPFMATLEQDLNFIASALVKKAPADWNALVKEIVESIQVLSFPKNVSSLFEERQSSQEGVLSDSSLHKESIIRILGPDKSIPVVKRIQSVIDMDIRGFILGMLWVILIGAEVDRKFGEWVYGNRLKKTVRNDPTKALTLSPYLFQPYFSQYESWRDKALRAAENIVDNDGDEAILLMTDLKAFYYSVDLRDNDLKQLCKHVYRPETDGAPAGGQEKLAAQRLNDFVLEVIKRYSHLYDGSKGNEKNILPIGFDPSCVLSNWCLEKFDREVIDRVRPAFYGRYVDDIILVVRAPKGSYLSECLNSEGFTVETSIKALFELSSDSHFRRGGEGSDDQLQYDLLCPISSTQAAEHVPEKNRDISYRINPKSLNCPKSEIELQASKTNLIAIAPNVHRPLLEHFKSTIAKNSSAFSLMPNVGDMDIDSVFEDIFEIDSAASPNKLRDLKELKLNPFELSKYLGQCQRVLPLVSDSKIRSISEQLLTLFSYQDLIAFYTVWEKLFEIMLFSGQINSATQLYCNIRRAIANLKLAESLESPRPNHGQKNSLEDIQSALCSYLNEILIKTIALIDENNVQLFLELIEEKYFSAETDQPLPGQTSLDEVSPLVNRRASYFKSNMVDKYAMPIPPAMVNAIFNYERLSTEYPKTTLIDIAHIMQIMSSAALNYVQNSTDQKTEQPAWRLEQEVEATLSPLPYMAKIQDIQFFLYCLCISYGENTFDLVSESTTIYDLINYFSYFNFRSEKKNSFSKAINDIVNRITVNQLDRTSPLSGYGDTGFSKTRSKIDHNIIGVNRKDAFNSNTVKIAVANVCLPGEILEDAIKGVPPQFSDYQALERLTTESKREGANLIVLPELSIPFCWIPRLATFSANEDIAIVCGIRYVAGGPDQKKVYNLTATILPFELESKTGTYRYAHLSLHNKVFFPPREVDFITNYQKTPVYGRSFDLFVWKDFWFPVYCCFELASPFERIFFSSLADALIAVEWNPDVGFYDNILSALARDMSCYCIQSNNSIYGDSRIEQPKETKNRTMLRITGGTNWSITIGNLDLAAIRDCQIKDDGGKNFKPPAPDYKHCHAKMRIDGTLWAYLNDRYSNGDDHLNSVC